MRLIYIIPIEHRTPNNYLVDDENIFNSDYLEYNYGKDKDGYIDKIYGEYINVIIYFEAEKKTQTMLNEELQIKDINFRNYDDDVILYFESKPNDTNKDGVIDKWDYTYLYLYSINGQQLRLINPDHSDLLYYRFIENSKNIMVRLGIDKNENGQFEENIESSYIYEYLYEQDTIIKISNYP